MLINFFYLDIFDEKCPAGVSYKLLYKLVSYVQGLSVFRVGLNDKMIFHQLDGHTFC